MAVKYTLSYDSDIPGNALCTGWTLG